MKPVIIRPGSYYICEGYSKDVIDKYYSPFRIIKVYRNFCICKKGEASWDWSKSFIRTFCKEITEEEFFLESI